MYVRFTVQYIPLSKIKPNISTNLTLQIGKLRNMMWDCMHLLVVRKNRKDGGYMILLGHDRYEFLRNHTKKLVAPCLVDESKPKAQVESWLHHFRSKWLPYHIPDIKQSRLNRSPGRLFAPS